MHVVYSMSSPPNQQNHRRSISMGFGSSADSHQQVPNNGSPMHAATTVSRHRSSLSQSIPFRPPPPPPATGHRVTSSSASSSSSYTHPSSIPPPPPSSSFSSGSLSPSVAAPNPASSVYRKHSRKRSSQVLVPPIVVSRKRSVKSTPIAASGNSSSAFPSSRSPDYDRESSLEDESDGSPGVSQGLDRKLNVDAAGQDLADKRKKDMDEIQEEQEDESGRQKLEKEEDQLTDEENEEIDDDEYVDGSGRKRNATVSAQTVASGATALIGAQFFSKIVTFSLNHALLRLVSPTLMGANAQFELVINTILFFSREAVRLAAQRQTLHGKSPDVYRFEGGVVHGTRSGTIQEVVNIGFVPFVLGIPLSLIILCIYYMMVSVPDAAGDGSSDFLGAAILIYGASALIELASEPSFLLAQLLSDFGVRASAESAAITIRCILTFIFVLLGKSQTSIIAFAMGQLSYSVVLSGVYIINAVKVSRHQPYRILMPSRIWDGETNKILIDSQTGYLAMGMWLQTLFKHCLTEGDRLLVSVFLPMSDQGVYALVVNYGSLLARLCFLPIEEALRNFFSKLLTAENNPAPLSDLASPVSPVMSGGSSFFKGAENDINSDKAYEDDESSNSPTSSTDEKHDSSIKSGNDHHLSAKANLSILVLSTVLRLYFYLGVFASVFGPLCGEYVLCLVVSSDWLISGASAVLAAYALYIPFLAINGSLEAFVQSVASVQDIRRQGVAMVMFSVIFALSGYVLMKLAKLGAVGLVYASMLNMAFRIGWSATYIESYYESHNQIPRWIWLKDAFPKPTVVSLCVACAAGAWRIGHVYTFSDMCQQVGLAGVLALGLIYAERDLVIKAIKTVK